MNEISISSDLDIGYFMYNGIKEAFLDEGSELLDTVDALAQVAIGNAIGSLRIGLDDSLTGWWNPSKVSVDSIRAELDKALDAGKMNRVARFAALIHLRMCMAAAKEDSVPGRTSIYDVADPIEVVLDSVQTFEVEKDSAPELREAMEELVRADPNYLIIGESADKMSDSTIEAAQAIAFAGDTQVTRFAPREMWAKEFELIRPQNA